MVESHIIDSSCASSIASKINSELCDIGLEAYPFKVKWYNERVSRIFNFPFNEETLAFAIISTPEMFEKAFIPFVTSKEPSEIVGSDCRNDPIDQCMMHHFKQLQNVLCDTDLLMIHDFELYPNRRPKVLVQTAGHVSGTAYYYQRSDLQCDPWPKSQKIYGVSIHPEYGGWFALRGVVLLKNFQCPNLERRYPKDILKSDDLKIKLLDEFNNRWQDYKYRDIVPVTKRYSEAQRLYFSTEPAHRTHLVTSIIKEFT